MVFLLHSVRTKYGTIEKTQSMFLEKKNIYNTIET